MIIYLASFIEKTLNENGPDYKDLILNSFDKLKND